MTPRQVFHFTNLPALSPVSILCIYWVYLYKWQGLYWAQRWQNKRLELAPLPRSADRLEALERQTRRCRSKGRRWQAIPCEPVWPSVRLVGKGTSVRIRFGFPFSSKVVDHKSWNINKFWNIRMFGWLKFSSQLISPFFLFEAVRAIRHYVSPRWLLWLAVCVVLEVVTGAICGIRRFDWLFVSY